MRTLISIAVLIVVSIAFVACKKVKKTPKPRLEFTDEEWEKYYEQKVEGMEAVLGKMHNKVGHALIPFDASGAVDMYYFPNGIEGTGFATMELINPDGYGPVANSLGTYELVAFTRHKMSDDENSEFGKMKFHVREIFTTLGHYVMDERVEPLETCELPQDEGESNICLIVDEYVPSEKHFKIGGKKHGLLLVIEIFPDEMQYAMDNGGDKLLSLLKDKGYYPYSDLNRVSVVN